MNVNKPTIHVRIGSGAARDGPSRDQPSLRFRIGVISSTPPIDIHEGPKACSWKPICQVLPSETCMSSLKTTSSLSMPASTRRLPKERGSCTRSTGWETGSGRSS